MPTPTILESVKQALRISNTAFDADEITDLIEAGKLDLKKGGVVTQPEGDKLVKRAIVLYSKANFGLANPDMEKYEKAYDKLKTLMALCKDYNVETVVE